MSRNVWVRWAGQDSAAASQFWGEVRNHSLDPRDGHWNVARSLIAAASLLEERDCHVSADELSELLRQMAAR
jgi:hypothetical protein